MPGLLLDILRIFLVLLASAFVASEIWSVDLGSLLAARGADEQVFRIARVYRDTRDASDHVNTIGAVGLPVGDVVRSERLPQCGRRAQ